MKPNASQSRLDLQEFLPYRLSVLTNTVSAALSQEYAERFELTIPQWRIMAVVGLEGGLSANQVSERTAMDKVMVSRALAQLVRARRVLKRVDPQDRRRVQLRLSARGQTIYAQIVPRARALERQLVDGLSSRDLAELERLLDTLWDSAQRLDTRAQESAA